MIRIGSERIEKDLKVSDRRSFSQEGERIGSDCRSTFDKRIGIGSQIRKKGIVQISGREGGGGVE